MYKDGFSGFSSRYGSEDNNAGKQSRARLDRERDLSKVGLILDSELIDLMESGSVSLFRGLQGRVGESALSLSFTGRDITDDDKVLLRKAVPWLPNVHFSEPRVVMPPISRLALYYHLHEPIQIDDRVSNKTAEVVYIEARPDHTFTAGHYLSFEGANYGHKKTSLERDHWEDDPDVMRKVFKPIFPDLLTGSLEAVS